MAHEFLKFSLREINKNDGVFIRFIYQDWGRLKKIAIIIRMPILKIILCACFLFAVQQLVAQSEPGKEEYVVVRQDEKITLYERWIPYPGTSTNARQVKGVFHVITSLNNMFATIHEEAKIKTWQKSIVEFKFIPKTDSTWLIYNLHEIPWPLTNQDYLLSYRLVEKNENRMILSFEHSLDVTLAPIKDDVDRMPTFGTWVLEKVSTGKVKVTYTVCSMPVSYPRFITDRIVRNNLMSTIHALIAVAENK